ncbi:MAG: UbiH/UbiF/VisC/COQ6 family ubiquinone biosynthesis hydroxylase [Gammaproteobacteria bacterium]|nr:UbiH/UbiF/VisC/COQ6 family ubiquinone biosynthesis hydroxylase [Gammaproteobacteria bacterium]
MKQTIDYDVVIVGAGMVGASLACALAAIKNTEGAGLKIAVLDARCPDMTWPDEGYDIRVSAITRATQNFLQDLNVWSYIEAQRLSPYREMQVWDASGEGRIQFDSADIGEADLGHIIENRVIVKALHQRLAQIENVDVLCPARLQSLEFLAQQVNLTQEDGKTFSARLLVAADGARSWVRQQAGISIKGWEYDQHALVTWVKTEKHHQDTAWQRFQPDGPLAFLPLTEGVSSIVWSTTPAHAKELCEMDENLFVEELASSFEHKLGAIEQVGPRAVFPLRYFETNAYIQSRLALVGDAAHLMHPLAGQGVNLGMADAKALSEVLREAVNDKRDLGELRVLRRYERWRRADNRSMLFAMDSFKKLFSSRSDAVRMMRNSGLNLVNRIPLIKHLFMQRALGQ